MKLRLWLLVFLGFGTLGAQNHGPQGHEIQVHLGVPIWSPGYHLQLEYSWFQQGRLLSAGYRHHRYQDNDQRYRAHEWYFSPGFRWHFRPHWFWDYRLGPALYYGPSELYSRGSGEELGPSRFGFSWRLGQALSYQPAGRPWAYSLRLELNSAVESYSPGIFQVSCGWSYRFGTRP